MTSVRRISKSARPRAIVIGIDGACWDVLRPLLDAGELPNLSALLSRGAARPLLSTRPPISPVAWTTMMTGVNPGRHGITGWADLVTQRVFSSGDVQAPFLWELLSRAGLTVGVFNVPMTCPAEPVNGYMVSGEIGAAELDARMFYPAQLLAETRAVTSEYPLPAAEAERTRYGFDRLQANARSRYELMAHLLRTRPADVVIAAVNYVDYAQHTGLKTRRTDGSEDVVAWAYRQADRFVGMVLEHAAEDAWVLVASDHGAGLVEGYVNLPALLRELGLLTLPRRSPQRWMLWQLRRLAVGARRRLPSSGRRRWLGQARHALRHHAYDWAHTIAYAVPASYGVALNTGERSPTPTVPAADVSRVAREVAAAIERVENPITGERDLRTFLAEEQYHGPLVGTGPEVLIEARACTYHLLAIGANEPEVFLTPAELAQRYPGLDRWEGMHRPEGVLILAGPGVENAALPAEPTVMDLAPTLLELMGVAVPEGAMDGRPLLSAGSAAPVRLSGADLGAAADDHRGGQYSPQEAQRVEKRLRDLGYL